MRHHVIGSRSGSEAGGVRCHSTEGVAEERRGGGSRKRKRKTDGHRKRKGFPLQHRKVTCRVLELLEKHKLYLRPDKCEFEKTTVEYLRVIISHNSVSMDPVKIAGVTEWPAPTNKKEVQSFLGFTNFYRRFIKDFSEHARPLFDLTRNDSCWHWEEAERTAFARLKQSVTSAPVLISPNPTKPFRIEADSSDFSTGCYGTS